MLKGLPVVNHDGGPEATFKFSLCCGDAIEMDNERGERELYIVRTLTDRKRDGIGIEYVRINDARKKKDIRAAREWFEKSVKQLGELGCRKVTIDPLGRVRWAND
jgi:hypothetical protein